MRSRLWMITALVTALGLAFVWMMAARKARAGAVAERAWSAALAVEGAPSPTARDAGTTITTPLAVYLPFLSGTELATYPRRLTSGPRSDTQPVFAPDGRTVVFLRNWNGQTDIFALTIRGGTPINLTRTPAQQEDRPIFSPDGSLIAYASNATQSSDWDIFVMNADGTNRRAVIEAPGSDEVHPWFSPDGHSLLFSSDRNGNWDIYRATIDAGAAPWLPLTTDPAVDRLPVRSPDGTAVVFRSERDGNSEVYLMDAGGTNQRPFTTHPAHDSYGHFLPDMSGIVFDSNRSGTTHSYVANPAGTGLVALEQRSDWRMMHSDVSNDGQWRVYAAAAPGADFDLYLDTFTSPLMAVGQQGMDNLQGNCYWESGVLAYGWSQAWQRTGQKQYLRWLTTYVNRCIAIRAINHVNDSLLGYAALIVYQADPQPAYLAFAQRVADWVMTDAKRTADGTLSHMDDGDRVWCDTVMSVAPFLTEMAKVTGNAVYFEEATSQILKHADHLQDPATGLYHHAWSASQNQYIGPAYWGRGNGWVLMADVAVLSAMSDTHPSRPLVLNVFRKQAAALRPLQSTSGLWPNVVDRPDHYLETSGSALIGYAFKRAVAAGWLEREAYTAATQAAILSVWRKVAADGIVTDVMGPTGPLANEADYDTLPHDQLQLYGQGVGLLIATP
ncbi:MAG TPA: hypothetical protein DEP84_33160 [Chloroflexi bacterium]|nr:hypothetical protein [Chloroflexota bacterium]